VSFSGAAIDRSPPANAGESRAFLPKTKSGQTASTYQVKPDRRSGIGGGQSGSANLNAANLESSAGWQLALTFEEIP
jgi:hypothetical protein